MHQLIFQALRGQSVYSGGLWDEKMLTSDSADGAGRAAAVGKGAVAGTVRQAVSSK